jgi:Zn finger protein HypA/HybF involved in hydrogenase expression
MPVKDLTVKEKAMNHQMDMFEYEDNHHKTFCPHCHQKIRKLNPHRMCKSKVALLDYIAKQEDWVRITNVHRVSIGDAAVLALRLEWFGLVEHGPQRSGLYRATQQGIDFLRGLHQVPKVIWCRDGKVIEHDSVMQSVHSVKKVVFDKEYWNNYPREY